MDEYSGLLSGMDDLNKYAGAQTMASGFASLANSYINYQALKTEAGNLNIQARDAFLQADQVELQAQEQANSLRKQFINAIGNATYNAAARGVKVTSANVQQNIERSAGEMDEDIRKSKKFAGMQVDNLRMKGLNLSTQARIAKKAGKAKLVTGMLNGISDIAMGSSIYGGGVENMGQKKSNAAATEEFAKNVGRNPRR